VEISKDKEGNTPLHVACASENQSGALLVVQTLLDASADFMAENLVKNTPIHVACLNGNSQILEYLISQMEEDLELTELVNIHGQVNEISIKNLVDFKYQFHNFFNYSVTCRPLYTLLLLLPMMILVLPFC